ncbi:MAG: SDR family NAD(P)-dependent oxidoreductase [Bacteroidota bacterium]
MNDFHLKYGEWALVAGAAEGIGAGFTEALAIRKMNVVMVDNNATALVEWSEKVERTHGVKTIRVLQDLSAKDAWAKCLQTIENLDCRLLIYVAAYSRVRLFLDHDQKDLDRFLDTNSRTPIHLVSAFADRLKKSSQRGGILLVSSLAGLIGPRYVAPYAATKAFNIILAEALYHEFKPHSIDIMVCCAGTTSTPMFWSTNPRFGSKKTDVMDPMDVVNYGLKKLGKKAICIPGWKNRLSYFILTRLMPRRLAARMVGSYMEKIYPQENQGS